MPAGAALAFAAAVECVAKHKAGQKHSTILGENEVQPITETEQKKSPLKKLKAFAARKIGGCRRPTKSKAKSPNRLQNPAQTSLEPTSDAPRGTLSANASIKPATSLEARAEHGERSVDRDLPVASPQPVEAIPDITCDVGVTSVLPRIDSESPGRAGEDLPTGEQVEVASDCIAIPLPLEKQVEFIGKRYPFKENIDPSVIAPLRPRDPSLPPLKRHSPRRNKVFGTAPARQLRAKVRPVVGKENEAPGVICSSLSIEGPSMESPAFEPTKSDVRVGNGVSSNACPTEYEDTPTSPSSVGDANSDLSDDTSPTASVATPVTDNSIDKVTLVDQVESSGVTSTGDIALSDPEVTEKIVLLWNMPTSVSTVGHGIPSDGAGEEVSPQDPSGDMVELDIELDEDVVARAENARLVRSGPGIMYKAERVTKHKEEMRRQAHVQVEVGEALGDNILAEPLTKPDYYRRSTNPRRINGVYYHGHPRVVRGWLANLPFAPYSAPVPRRGLVWQDQLDPLDLPSEHPDNAEINNEATSVGPAPNASSSQSGPGWWNVPAMLQKAGAALRVF